MAYAPLQVRGGDGGGSAALSVSGTALQSTAAVNGAAAAKDASASAVAVEPAQETAKSRRRYLRIAKELGRHVWPKVPSKKKATAQGKATEGDVNKERKAALAIRYRVIASVFLMLAGKAVTIATPFLFKMLVDIVPGYIKGTENAGGTMLASNFLAAYTILSKLPVPLPILLLLCYGLCRSLSSLFRELTNAIFAHVAQSAIRRFGRTTFDHVHSLDLQYHLNRNTGALSRVLERGSRSISFALNALVFNTIPTLGKHQIVCSAVVSLLFSTTL